MATHSAHTRAALAAATALALSFGVAACSSSGSGGSGGGGKSFTYWSMWKVGEPQQKVIAGAIADFEKKTGDKVNVQWVGRNNLQKLTPALNTNNVPDLVDGPYLKAYPALVSTNQALGLTAGYADKTADGQSVSSVIPAKYTKSINIKLPDGKPWMMPYNVQSDAIWFNAAKYPDLKTNPPKTWDQFTTLLSSMKAKGVTPIAADGDVPGYNAAWLTTLIDRSGGPGTLMKISKDKTGQAWKQPSVLAAVNKVEQIVKGGDLISGYDASKFPFQQQKWANNKAALVFMGTWLPTESASYAAPGFVPASFPFPTTGTHDSQRLDLSGFMVPKKAKNATAAQQFAAFFLSKKYQDAWATKANVIPVRTDTAVAPALTGVVKTLSTATSFHAQNDGVAFPGYNDKVFWPNDDKLFLGKFTPQQFVDAMASGQATYWKNQGK